MLARVSTITLVGLDGHPVDVEVAIAQGLPSFNVVGLPDASIQEARERVRAAITATGEPWPQQRVTVNLSPAHLRKAGSSFDLAIALGVLAASGRVPPERLAGRCVLGELSLDGTLRRIRGVLAAAVAAARAGWRSVIVPAANAREAAIVDAVEVGGAADLASVLRDLRGIEPLAPVMGHAEGAPAASEVDWSDVRGQVLAKRALEIAAAGGHNVLMTGPPGGGKTMLARRFPTILPPMTKEESFEITRIHSVAGLLPEGAGLVTSRPFRAPHHTASTTGLIGGGSGSPVPGEVTLAHRGCLFLDELGEFRLEAMQALRQPLEDGTVTIVRSRWAVTYPARFQLIAASNPCPCGLADEGDGKCVCVEARRRAYTERLSGPVIDRVDLAISVARVDKQDLFAAPEGEPSAAVAARVARAREIQRERWKTFGFDRNAEIPPRRIERSVSLDAGGRARIERGVEARTVTARGAHRAIRVARTIADLEGSEVVTTDHVREALALRVPDAL